MTSSVRAAVGLGSNLGDRLAHLQFAVDELGSACSLEAISSVYETEPIGDIAQGPYLNAVVVMATRLTPRHLLGRLQEIEAGAGRVRGEKWGPRTLDLDLLLYGSRSLAESGLAVPHPRLTERRFVLQPLLEIWPDARLPDGTPLAGLLERVASQSVVSHEAGLRPPGPGGSSGGGKPTLIS